MAFPLSPFRPAFLTAIASARLADGLLFRDRVHRAAAFSAETGRMSFGPAASAIP